MRLYSFLLATGLAAGIATAQTPQFEVATIHPSDPLTRDGLLSGKRSIGVRVTGNQVTYGYMSLRDLIVNAYGVKPAQVNGPDWITDQRFEITALMPEGAGPEQAPVMLQALLRDRFKLVAKKEPKEQQVYGLEVGKDGPKMQPARQSTQSDVPAEPAAGPVLNVGGRDLRITQNPSAQSVSILGGRGGAQKISMGSDGQMHIEIERLTMPDLADALTPMLDLPVLDRTGLAGAFQVTLELGISDLLGAVQRAGISLPAAAARLGGGPGIAAGGPTALAASDPGGTIFSSIQKLGLKLEKQKGLVDTVVIESADRNPSEN